MILPTNNGNLVSHIAQLFSHIIVGIEQSLSSLVNQINIPEGGLNSQVLRSKLKVEPVKIFNHRLEFLKLLNTEFVFLEEPHCTRRKVSPVTRLGGVLPVLAGGGASQQPLLLDLDHHEGIAVAPLPAVLALLLLLVSGVVAVLLGLVSRGRIGGQF